MVLRSKANRQGINFFESGVVGGDIQRRPISRKPPSGDSDVRPTREIWEGGLDPSPARSFSIADENYEDVIVVLYPRVFLTCACGGLINEIGVPKTVAFVCEDCGKIIHPSLVCKIVSGKVADLARFVTAPVPQATNDKISRWKKFWKALRDLLRSRQRSSQS